MATNTGDGYIRVSTDIKECMDFFEGLDVNKAAIRRSILRRIGTGAKSSVKRNYGFRLRKRSGTLYKSIDSRISRSGKSVVITNNAKSGNNTAKDGRDARYGFMLAAGYTIKPKDEKKTLTFNINGKWFRKKEVTVRPIDWVEPPVNRYMNSADCKNRIDAEFQKQVDYWDKRITGGTK